MGFDWELFIKGLVKTGIITDSYVKQHRLLDHETYHTEYFNLLLKVSKHTAKQAEQIEELTTFVNDCAVSHIESRYKYRARLLMSKYKGKE